MNKTTSRFIGLTFAIILNILFCPVYGQHSRNSVIKGTVKSGDTTLDYATVFLKGTLISTNSDESGGYILKVPAGKHGSIALTFRSGEYMIMKGLPTSSSDLSQGQLYVDAGTLKIKI